MFCKNSHHLLTRAAAYYAYLGYQIGVTHGKGLVSEYYSPQIDPTEWNNISIVLDGLVCVDFDCFTSLDGYELPPTLKERTRRGLHYFYRLPRRFVGISKIGWKKNIDILTKTPRHLAYYKGENQWQGHVLCSPSKGYSRLYPNATPRRDNLPIAPDWILDNLRG